MSKPIRHAISSAKQFGGVAEDYLPIHDFMDSSKSAFADNRHRVLTHNAWFIGPQGPLELAFGHEILVPREDEFTKREFSQFAQRIMYLEREIQHLRAEQRTKARVVSVRDVGEQHILEDFQGRFIPNASDYIQYLEFRAWMDNGNKGVPPSAEKLQENRVTTTIRLGD